MTCLTDDMLSFSKKSRHQKYFTRKPAINMPFLCDHRYMWIKNEYFPEAIPWHSRSKPRASGSGHLGVSHFLFPLFSERSWPPVSVWLLQLPVRIFPGSVFLSTIRGWKETLFSLLTGAASRPDTPALQAQSPLSILAPAPQLLFLPDLTASCHRIGNLGARTCLCKPPGARFSTPVLPKMTRGKKKCPHTFPKLEASWTRTEEILERGMSLLKEIIVLILSLLRIKKNFNWRKDNCFTMC